MNRLVEWARESKVTEEEGVEETLRVGEEEEGDGTGDEGTAKPRDVSQLSKASDDVYSHRIGSSPTNNHGTAHPHRRRR